MLEKKFYDLQPIFKYTGSKRDELDIIDEFLPDFSGRYIEPFVGGGALFWHIKAKEYLINDISTEVCNIYSNVQRQDKYYFNFLEYLNSCRCKIAKVLDDNKDYFNRNNLIFKQDIDTVIANLDIFSDYLCEYKQVFYKQLDFCVGLKNKHKMIKERKYNYLCVAVHNALFNTVRIIHNTTNNKDLKSASFFYLINFTLTARFNSKGEFNNPYGGFSYNKRNFKASLDYLKNVYVVRKMQKTKIFNLDYREFLDQIRLTSDDFIFFDPPYDKTTISYNGIDFVKQQQIELRQVLDTLPCKYMMIIKETDFIQDLYNDICVYRYNKDYKIKRTKNGYNHMVITNY